MLIAEVIMFLVMGIQGLVLKLPYSTNQIVSGALFTFGLIVLICAVIGMTLNGIRIFVLMAKETKVKFHRLKVFHI